MASEESQSEDGYHPRMVTTHKNLIPFNIFNNKNILFPIHIWKEIAYQGEYPHLPEKGNCISG